jgi:hypothetical protein
MKKVGYRSAVGNPLQMPSIWPVEWGNSILILLFFNTSIFILNFLGRFCGKAFIKRDVFKHEEVCAVGSQLN